MWCRNEVKFLTKIGFGNFEFNRKFLEISTFLFRDIYFSVINVEGDKRLTDHYVGREVR